MNQLHDLIILSERGQHIACIVMFFVDSPHGVGLLHGSPHALKHSKKRWAFGTILMLGTQMLLILTEKKKFYNQLCYVSWKTCRKPGNEAGSCFSNWSANNVIILGRFFFFSKFFQSLLQWPTPVPVEEKNVVIGYIVLLELLLLWTYIDEENQTTYLQGIRVSDIRMTVMIKSVHQTYMYVPYCCHWWEPYLVYKCSTNNRSKKCTVEW